MAKKNRQRAKKMAARGVSAAKIARKTGVSQNAANKFVARAASQSPAQSMQIYQQGNGDRVTTQAPPRPSHVQPSYVDAGSGRSFNTRFVPGAMLPGQKGYDPATGGGVWAAGGTDEEIRAWFRSADPANTAGDLAIAQSGKDASAFTLDGLFGQGVGQQAAEAEAQSKERTGYKGIKGIRQGLRIGGNNTLSKKEAKKIAKNTNKSYDKVLAKGLKFGFQLNPGTVKRSNKLASKNLDYMKNPAKDPLLTMRNLELGKGQVYSGAYMRDGVSTPIVESKSRGNNPLRKKNPLVINNDPEVTTDGGGGGGGAVNTDTSNAGNFTPQEPIESETNDLGVGMMSGGGFGAAGASKLGRAKSRLRKLGIYGKGTSLLGRGLQYGNVLNK